VNSRIPSAAVLIFNTFKTSYTEGFVNSGTRRNDRSGRVPRRQYILVNRRWAILSLTAAVFAAPLGDPSAVLARGRTRIADAIRNLPRYTCTETVERRYFEPIALVGRMACDDLTAKKRRGELAVELVAEDRLRLEVAVADRGSELYSWPGTGKLEGRRIDQIAGGGPSSSGPFGPFLVDIFLQPATRFTFRGESGRPGQTEMNYRFSVPLGASHYTLWTGNSHRTFSYDGSFVLDGESGELRQLTVRTSELPNSPACEATSLVNFEQTKIGAGEYLLPKATTLHFLRRNGNETENTTVYSACHEFRGESEIRFEDPQNITESSPDSAAQRKVLPAGIRMTLALTNEINTSTAAAGDPVTANVSPEILDLKYRKYFPKNSLAKGRITHLERRFVSPGYALVSMVFDSIETKDGVWRCDARLNRKIKPADGSEYWTGSLTTHTSFPSEGTLLFRAPHGELVIPRGFSSGWVTVSPHRH
jgi:hypothetical protein